MLSMALGVTTGYTCGSSYCSAPSGTAADKLFRQIQGLLNRFTKLGFSSLSVDGRIGSKTGAAAQKTLGYLQSVPDSAVPPALRTDAYGASRVLQLRNRAAGLFPATAHYAPLAERADELASLLELAAAMLTTPSTSAPSPGLSPAPSPGQLPAFVPPALPGWWAQRSTAEKAILVIGAVSAVGTGLLLLLPKRRRSTSVA